LTQNWVSMNSNINEEIAARINAIAAVARTGVAWTRKSNEEQPGYILYEQERYERILELAAEIADLMSAEEVPPYTAIARELRDGWLAQVTPGASGYVTPKVSTAALVFDPQGRLLLGKRGDSGLWFIPTGWLEVGLTPAQNIIKEVREETGIECRPVRLVAVRDTRFSRAITGTVTPNPNVLHNIALTFMCEALTTEFKLHPLETTEAGFFEEAEALALVPERARLVLEQGFAARRGELKETFYDEV
jgi:ADP-ribose pyrophosphatase YjhB (NUDIX family)